MTVGGDEREDWAGDQVDLRAAENHFVTGPFELISQGTAEGTETVDALIFDAPEDLEILAIAYSASVVSHSAATADPSSVAGRRTRGKRFNVTVRDGFGEGRNGDFLTDEVLAKPDGSFEDETNGTGGEEAGAAGNYHTLMDPGLDSPTAPLVMAEGERLSVHLEQTGNAAPGSPNEQVFRQILEVYWEEIEGDVTEVRDRGSFPSGREVTI